MSRLISLLLAALLVLGVAGTALADPGGGKTVYGMMDPGGGAVVE